MNDPLRAEGVEAYALVGEARRARQSAEQMRQMAAERARKLESKLREAAEAGMRAEIARQINVRRRLRALQKVTADTQRPGRHQSSADGEPASYRAPVAAFLAWLGVSVALALAATGLHSSRTNVAASPALQAAPGEPIALRLSYTLRDRAAR